MWRNTLPRLEILSTDEVEAIHHHATVILEEIGVDFLLPRAVELFEDAGMSVEGERVRFDPDWVRAQVARAPAVSELQARNLGYVTSANFGYSAGRSIAYGYLPADLAEVGRRVEIEYFGVRHAATVTAEPLYEPAMHRLKETTP